MKKLRGIFLIGLLLSMLSAGAVTKTWTGALNTAYSIPPNWSPSGVPTASDDVIIGLPANGRICKIISARTVNSLTILPNGILRLSGGGDLTVNNDFIIESDLTGMGAVVLLDGTDIDVNGNFKRQSEVITVESQYIGTAKALGNPAWQNGVDNQPAGTSLWEMEYEYIANDNCVGWVEKTLASPNVPDEGYVLWVERTIDPEHLTYDMNDDDVDYTQTSTITMPSIDNTHDACSSNQSAGSGWGLLANPFLTSISLRDPDDFINIDDYDPIIYLWEKNQYEIMNIGVPAWPAGNELYLSQNLPSNQGFMIHTKSGVSNPSALQIRYTAQNETGSFSDNYKNATASLTPIENYNNAPDYPDIERTGYYELLFQVNMEYNVNSTTNRNTAFFWVSDGEPLGGGGIISTNSTGFKDSKTYYGQEYGYADVIAQSVVADYDRDTYVPDIGFAIANGITSPNNYRSGDAGTATINGTWLDSYEDYTKLRTDEFIPDNSTGTLLKFYFNNDIANTTFTGEIDPDILDGAAKSRNKLPVQKGDIVKGSKSRPTAFTMSFDGISELYTNGNYVVYMHIYTYSTSTQKWSHSSSFQITDATTLDDIPNNMVNKQYLFQIVRAGGKKDATVLPFSNASINRNNTSYRIIGLEQQAKQIEIYSVSGAKLQTIEAQNADVIDIATNELSSGVYLARIVGLDNRQKTMKFLVQ